MLDKKELKLLIEDIQKNYEMIMDLVEVEKGIYMIYLWDDENKFSSIDYHVEDYKSIKRLREDIMFFAGRKRENNDR